MKNCTANGYGASITIQGDHVTVQAHNKAGEIALTARELQLAATDISAATLKPAKFFSNGALLLGTAQGIVTVHFLRKQARAFEAVQSALLEAGIPDEPSLIGLPPYNAKVPTIPATNRQMPAKADPTGAVDVEIDEELLHGILTVMAERGTHPRVVERDDSDVYIDVVGESFYQEQIAVLSDHGPGEDAGWQYGFLAPEPDDEYDPNAVAVYAIIRKPSLDADIVGHVPREMAAQLSPILASEIVERGRVVPLLIRVTGGTKEKPSYGISARAYCALVSEPAGA